MPKIIANEDFLHEGYPRFEAEQEYDVPEGLDLYFCNNGWARRPGEDAPSPREPVQEPDLDIQNSKLGSSSKIKGR